MTRIAAPPEPLVLSLLRAVDSPLAHDARREPPASQLPVERVSDGELIRPPVPDHPAFERLRVASTYDAGHDPAVDATPPPATVDNRSALARFYANSASPPGEKTGLIVNTYV